MSVTAVIVVLGPGAPRPEVEAAARRTIVEAADDADAALAALAAVLEPAVEAGRTGSARAVAGDEAPGPKLDEAAEITRGAEERASVARRALIALDRARNAADPGAPRLHAVTEAGELESIAAQLSASATAAGEFAAMRERASSVVAELDAALGALDAGHLDPARGHVARAREAHTAIAEWDVGLVTLPIWIDTTDAMIGAVERIITATERGDATGADRAAGEFAALSEDAATADRALRIAIGEGGSAVSAVPLERLAVILTAVSDTRAIVASIREAAEK